MNPQKYNEHTALNHSILWRKSYTFEKPITHQSGHCHKQLNPLAQTGVSWRTRNNMIQTNFSGVKSNTTSFRNTKSMSRVNDLLKDNKSESPQTRNLKQSLTANSNVLQKSLKLVQGMEKLKDIRLLENKDLQRVKYPGIIRHAHVYNDYHERVTNPGFSRNVAGKHFTK